MKKIALFYSAIVSPVAVVACETAVKIELSPVAGAYIELQQKKLFVEAEICAARATNRKAPDFFGLTQEKCLLPAVRACCEDAFFCKEFLDLVTEKSIRRALAKNCMGQLYKNKAELVPIAIFATEYKLQGDRHAWWIIEGQDIRKLGNYGFIEQ